MIGRRTFQARVREQPAEAVLCRRHAEYRCDGRRGKVGGLVHDQVRLPGGRLDEERVELRGGVERREAVGKRFRTPLVRRHLLDPHPECLHLRAKLAQADTRGQRGEPDGRDALGEIRGRRERDLVPAVCKSSCEWHQWREVAVAGRAAEEDAHPAIMLGQSPERDRDIEAMQIMIRNCATASTASISISPCPARICAPVNAGDHAVPASAASMR